MLAQRGGKCCLGAARSSQPIPLHVARASHGHGSEEQPHVDRRDIFLASVVAPVLMASWALPAQAVTQLTTFEKLLFTCTARQQLLEAARAVAEFDLCVALPTCAPESRGGLKRQAEPMFQAAIALRENLPKLAAQALKRGPPSPALGLLLQDNTTVINTWPSTVSTLQSQTDSALVDMQNQAYAIMTDPQAAWDPERLGRFATCIKTSRELYNKFADL